ncbi:hypothetical protein MANES_10G028900v8 [Manihot esculenta]|uniref:Cyclin-dependent protein kinase inhibitor SMR4 n=1 Tax=Manihot esculenta TaxID=3983 RepID=A0A2C9V2S6_MANES|nr:hypothetical protein MANES_10G028900v8 [Manihot esculenta]
MEADHEGCKTPMHRESRILTALECPPPPARKKPVCTKQRSPPKDGYFNPPDLEAFFTMLPRTRREACA